MIFWTFWFFSFILNCLRYLKNIFISVISNSMIICVWYEEGFKSCLSGKGRFIIDSLLGAWPVHLLSFFFLIIYLVLTVVTIISLKLCLHVQLCSLVIFIVGNYCHNLRSCCFPRYLPKQVSNYSVSRQSDLILLTHVGILNLKDLCEHILLAIRNENPLLPTVQVTVGMAFKCC